MRATIAVATLSCAFVAAACGDSTSPADSAAALRQITLEFCPARPPTWVAHLDDGGQWTPVLVANAKATFAGTEKQAVAVVSSGPYGSTVEVVYSTATTLSGVRCRSAAVGTSTISGTARGLQGKVALLALGRSTAATYNESDAFTFRGVPSSALDLVAARTGDSYGASRADRMIIRRARSYANGALVNVDFDSDEAFGLETHTISTVGGATGSVSISHALRTAGGTRYYLGGGTSGSMVSSVPASKLVAGDVHESIAYAFGGSTGTQVAYVYHKNPGNRTLTFGPAINLPTVTTLAAAPDRRLRMEVEALAAYPSGATAAFSQDEALERSWVITLLADYEGLPASKWTIDMPDFTGVAGFEAAWKLDASPVSYSVQVVGAPYAALTGNLPLDGDVLRFAVRFVNAPSAPSAPATSPRTIAQERLAMRPQLFATLLRE